MRLWCFFCGKSVSTEVDRETIVRAVLICPECIEADKILFPDDAKRDEALTEPPSPESVER